MKMHLHLYLRRKLHSKKRMKRQAVPFKEFMSKHTRQKDLELFLRYNKAERPESIEDIPLTMLVPAFALK